MPNTFSFLRDYRAYGNRMFKNVEPNWPTFMIFTDPLPNYEVIDLTYKYYHTVFFGLRFIFKLRPVHGIN